MGHSIPETQEWIKKVIDSCKNDYHFDGAQIVIDQFKDICHEDIHWAETQDYWNQKYNEVYCTSLIN
jgi:hypothetical protein